jgi:hypothetical protein
VQEHESDSERIELTRRIGRVGGLEHLDLPLLRRRLYRRSRRAGLGSCGEGRSGHRDSGWGGRRGRRLLRGFHRFASNSEQLLMRKRNEK